MSSAHWRKILAPIFLSLLLLVAACTPTTPSRYADVQQETTQRRAAPAVAKSAEQGATFNKIFPTSVQGYDIVPAQEKKGFAEYKVNQAGKTVAMLSISDTTSLPTAAAKYQQATAAIAGYPSVEQGTTATGILVNNRYQVKVLSRDPSFTQSDRIAWIQKFDLKKLAKLKPAAAPTLTLTPTPAKLTAKPVASTSQPEASTSEPVKLTSKPEALTSEPVKLTSQPEASTSKPETLTSEPVKLISQPEVSTSKPEVSTSKPVALTSEPVALTSEPVASTSEPVASTSEPVASTSEPVASTSEPEALAPEPST